MSKKFKIFVAVSLTLAALLGIYLYVGRSKVKDLDPAQLAEVQAKNAEYLKNWQENEKKKKIAAEAPPPAADGEEPKQPTGPVKLLEDSEQPDIPGYDKMNSAEKVAAVAALTREKVRKKFGATESRLSSEPYPRPTGDEPVVRSKGRQPLKKLRQYVYTKLYGVRTSFVIPEGMKKPQVTRLLEIFDSSCMSDREKDNHKCKFFILGDADLLKSLVDENKMPEGKPYKIYCATKDCLDPFGDTAQLKITSEEIADAEVIGTDLEVVKPKKNAEPPRGKSRTIRTAEESEE